MSAFGRGLSVSSFGWKPIPSTARVTRDEVSGLHEREGRLSGRQYLHKQDLRGHRYVRQKRLDDANSTITKAKQRLAEIKYEHSRMQEVLGEDRDLQSIQLQRNMLATFINMLDSSLEPLTSTLTDRQQEIVNESGYTGLSRNSNQIINCAILLSLGYIHEATTYAESCGGGGSPSSGWGRDKDEDDEHGWRRCIAVSAAMMRPAKYRVRRSR